MKRYKKAGKRYHASEEDTIQIGYFDLVKFYKEQYPILKNIYSVPNGLYLKPWYAQLAVDSGMTAGIWDVAIDVACGTYHGARMEFKTATGRLSPAQKERKLMYEQNGYLPVVCRSIDEAWCFSLDYLGLVSLKNFYYKDIN